MGELRGGEGGGGDGGIDGGGGGACGSPMGTAGGKVGGGGDGGGESGGSKGDGDGGGIGGSGGGGSAGDGGGAASVKLHDPVSGTVVTGPMCVCACSSVTQRLMGSMCDPLEQRRIRAGGRVGREAHARRVRSVGRLADEHWARRPAKDEAATRVADGELHVGCRAGGRYAGWTTAPAPTRSSAPTRDIPAGRRGGSTSRRPAEMRGVADGRAQCAAAPGVADRVTCGAGAPWEGDAGHLGLLDPV